jgi:hypothetical protein
MLFGFDLGSLGTSSFFALDRLDRVEFGCGERVWLPGYPGIGPRAKAQARESGDVNISTGCRDCVQGG